MGAGAWLDVVACVWMWTSMQLLVDVLSMYVAAYMWICVDVCVSYCHHGHKAGISYGHTTIEGKWLFLVRFTQPL